MNKSLVMLVALSFVIAAAGCTSVSVKKESIERVDVEVAGNQGVIYGPVPAPHKVEGSREIIAVDVELPTYQEVKTSVKKEVVEKPAPKEDNGATGNAGTISQKTEKIK
ncbi:MAG: hypothetical protein NTV07_05585 [Candidatus Omnitrophica bacterium]|nr:hypothetical protein [Candidatus Omnitrophota bacterium]